MSKLGQWFRNFMMGRYGTDKLNLWILMTGVVAMVFAMLLGGTTIKLILTAVSYGLLILALWRSFSRQTYKRYQENRKFLQFLDRFKDRQHRYFNCPKCRQVVRVPRGKGKIAITCPKCRERFIKKT